jgi:hypothetical protein
MVLDKGQKLSEIGWLTLTRIWVGARLGNIVLFADDHQRDTQ